MFSRILQHKENTKIQTLYNTFNTHQSIYEHVIPNIESHMKYFKKMPLVLFVNIYIYIYITR